MSEELRADIMGNSPTSADEAEIIEHPANQEELPLIQRQMKDYPETAMRTAKQRGRRVLRPKRLDYSQGIYREDTVMDPEDLFNSSDDDLFNDSMTTMPPTPLSTSTPNRKRKADGPPHISFSDDSEPEVGEDTPDTFPPPSGTVMKQTLHGTVISPTCMRASCPVHKHPSQICDYCHPNQYHLLDEETVMDLMKWRTDQAMNYAKMNPLDFTAWKEEQFDIWEKRYLDYHYGMYSEYQKADEELDIAAALDKSAADTDDVVN